MRLFFLSTLFLLLLWSLTVTASSVSVGGDLFLGVWSPLQSRWESRVPVCVATDASQSPYRIVAFGQNPSQFALSNELDDHVRYTVIWHTGKNYTRADRLASLVPSKAYGDAGNCQSRPTGYIRVQLNKRDIDNAIPAVYQDTLLVMLSPL